VKKKVRLDEIALAIGSDPSEGSWYLDTESGITENVTDSIMDAVLRKIALPVEVPADVRLMWKRAEDILFDEKERFLKLPGRLDVLEWDIMRRFAQHQMDPALAADLTASIQGLNAFQAFNAKLRALKLQEAWQSYREDMLRDVAAEWCAQHGVPFE
jgi:hypothetical protein